MHNLRAGDRDFNRKINLADAISHVKEYVWTWKIMGDDLPGGSAGFFNKAYSGSKKNFVHAFSGMLDAIHTTAELKTGIRKNEKTGTGFAQGFYSLLETRISFLPVRGYPGKNIQQFPAPKSRFTKPKPRPPRHLPV